MADLSFTVTGRCQIELLAESRGISWIVEISKDGKIRFLRNMKEVEAFPSTPLTKRLVAATGAILPEAVAYLARSWEHGRPLDDAEGKAAWWRMKDIVESF
jgi:hypothetical protein